MEKPTLKEPLFSYEAPRCEVVDIFLEKGFAGSEADSGAQADSWNDGGAW